MVNNVEHMRTLMEKIASSSSKQISEDASSWAPSTSWAPNPNKIISRDDPEFEMHRADAVLALQGDPRSRMRKDVARKWLIAHGFSEDYIEHHASKDVRSTYWKPTWSGDADTHFMPPPHFSESDDNGDDAITEAVQNSSDSRILMNIIDTYGLMDGYTGIMPSGIVADWQSKLMVALDRAYQEGYTAGYNQSSDSYANR